MENVQLLKSMYFDAEFSDYGNCAEMTVKVNDKHVSFEIEIVNSKCTISLKHIDWIDRNSYDRIIKDMPLDTFDAIEYVLNNQAILNSSKVEPFINHSHIQETITTEVEKSQLKRVTFKLVSLSTKSKRDDLVQMAPEFNLTGFILAGKPAIVVLEGEEKMIDAFMAKIKTISWADIAPVQKKISVAFVEEIENQVFRDMSEITDLFTRAGHRKNILDKGEVAAWFQQASLDHIFKLVFT